VRDPSYLFPNVATQPASEALLTIGMRHLSVIGTYIIAYFARRTVFSSVVSFCDPVVVLDLDLECQLAYSVPRSVPLFQTTLESPR